MKIRQIIVLLVGTILMLLLLAHALPFPAFAQSKEGSSRVLSWYLMDTEVLIDCAKRHRTAFETRNIIAPEIRAAIISAAFSE